MAEIEIGSGTVTISTKEYVLLIDKSRRLANLEANYKEHIDQTTKQRIVTLEQAYKTACSERYDSVMQAQKLRKQIELNARIPLFIRKFFNAI